MSDNRRHRDSGYEHADASARGVGAFALALALVLVIIAFAMRWLFVSLDPAADASAVPQHPLAAPSEPPGPKLQAYPSDELVAARARESEALSKYEWIDPQARVVRIPIERAMDLIVERGLPVRK